MNRQINTDLIMAGEYINRVMDYISIDLETPNKRNDSISQIALIEVKNGRVVSENVSLINPEQKFDDFNMTLTGITPSKVINAPTILEFWKTISGKFNDDTIILGHGIKFDICVLTKALRKHNIEFPCNKIIDTAKLTRCLLKLDNNKLNTVCDFFDIPLSHHDAGEDARGAHHVFEKLKREFNLNNSVIELYKYDSCASCERNIKTAYTEDTRGMQELKASIESILEDGVIDGEEVGWLSGWMNEHKNLIGYYPFDKINELVSNVLEDGIITPEEKSEMFEVFGEFVDPLKHRLETQKTIIMENKVFCLTGSFVNGTKEGIANYILSKGGKVIESVTLKLDYLIVGGQGNDSWKFGNYGGKISKVMQNIEKGKSNTEIIAEEEFLQNVGWTYGANDSF